MLQDLSEKDTKTFHNCYAILHDHVSGTNPTDDVPSMQDAKNVNNFNQQHSAVAQGEPPQQPITPHNSANMHVPAESAKRHKHTELLLQLLSKSNFMNQAVPNSNTKRNSAASKSNAKGKRGKGATSKKKQSSQVKGNQYEFDDISAVTPHNGNNDNLDDDDDNVFASIVSPTMGGGISANGAADVDIAKFAENLLATPRSSAIMNGTGGMISSNNTPINMYKYNLNGQNDMPDVNFQEVADYFNLTSPLMSLSSLNGQTTGSAKNKAKFTFDDFDVNNRDGKKRSVNPSVAAIVGNKSPGRQNSGKHDVQLLQPLKKRRKGPISVNTDLANRGSGQASVSSNKDKIKVGDTVKQIPESARFAKEMWGRKK